ncbi:unnamed protein product [Diatraea saccharalis]|uniref:Uncharacterized protein n=1 Tax=Diatraea saccharalis TaxID=40085 RepID=A0A9N9W8R6_9NEOP|nr:unnamed protein product [Diatraea saccharalis]
MYKASDRNIATSLFLSVSITIFWTPSAYRKSDTIFYLRDMLNSTLYNQVTDNKMETVIENEGCTIPQVIWSPKQLSESYMKPELLKPCQSIRHPLLKNNQTHIWVLDENLPDHHVNKFVNFECCYQATQYIKRKNKYTKTQCEYFKNYIKADDEYVRVTCRYNLKVIYEQFFVFATKKPFTVHRPHSFVKLQNDTEYNVIILGLGSISRANFHRTMRHTSKFLAERGAVELLGYNKVAESTFLNMMPVLTGMAGKQLKKTCWPKARTTLDSCSFIWERFKDEGYYSAFIEDSNGNGILKDNNYGFSSPPTDYYLHPSFHETSGKNNICLGNEFIYSVSLDHLENIIFRTKSSKLFALFWESSMSHEYLNFPMVMDDTYAAFLRNIEHSGYLNETILIVLSDSGLKSSGGKSLGGKFLAESNLPIANIWVPQSFRSEYSVAFENLKINSGRLTTAFDIHATLIDLIDLYAIRNPEIATRASMNYTNRRGISLFLPISGSRTCAQSGIKKRLCACRKNKKTTLKKKHKKKVLRS